MRIGIIIVAITIGLGYGYVSALQNQNPHYPPVGTTPLNPNAPQNLASSWSPSPIWLPSYALCRIPPGKGFGIRHSKSGFMFSDNLGRGIYFAGSTILGGIMGCLVGGIWLIVTRRDKEGKVEPVAAQE